MIRDEFAKVKTAKNFGIVTIFCYVLRLVFPSIEKFLTFLFINTSVQTSHSAGTWEISRVTLSFKDGDRNEKCNYHPISVLLVISMLLISQCSLDKCRITFSSIF